MFLFWFVLIFLTVVLLRLPSLFEPFTYGDEGIYLTLGLAIRKGLVLYRDIHDNKPPLLYLLAALSGPNFANFRAILFVWSLTTIGVFFLLAKKIFSQNQKSVIVSTSLFAILTSVHNFEGNIGNAENFMLLPTLLGIYLILEVLDKRRLGDARVSNVKQLLSASPADLRGSFSLFFAGIMFSFATLFKIPAAIDFLAVLVFMGFIFLRSKKRYLSPITYHLSTFFLGLTLPILVTVIYYAIEAALNQYLSAAFFQNIPYLTSWGTGSQSLFNPFRSGLFWRGFLLFAVCCLLFMAAKRFSKEFLLIILWFLFSLFAALLSSRPYPHYLIQVLPSLSLLLGFLTLRVGIERIFAFLAFFIFNFSFLIFHFWYYPNIPYYKNFYQYALGQKTKEEYFANFDSKANDIYKAAEFVSTHSLPNERIFIWGNEPFIYALSRRLPPGRYTVAYHIIDFNGWEETIQAIEKDKTDLIMTAPVADHDFPALEQSLLNRYIKIGEVGEYKFYKLMEADKNRT